ncbi:N-acetylglucosamine-6-phosphate deacetylase [Oceanibacterium hippocampi]|uniref:N-acetylglucosamine-6-phosphate deacetylase n=2 Tax=Oceanibacterium hippocampi TaxID=745714 RepID=A0A1Y5U3J3_9PROT|nr:N-acetylglucosamine-6-phosphate deacetylase [Oceanibacterium hippocampi]SLN75980.1 N-acetylglucosamine-6-phosphate deacetylase [Oceanibacterium hippocampi]
MTSSLVAYPAAEIFDGERFLRDAALLVVDGRVEGVVPLFGIPSAAERIDLGTRLIAPGFIDWQVNGGGGVLFNDAPTVDTLRRIAAAHAAFGTTSLLPTLISTDPETTKDAADAVGAALAEGLPGIAGIHFEGPHLNPRRAGAHPTAALRPMDAADRALYGRAGLGRVVVTVAPEIVSPDDIAALAAAGVVVSLGHSDASAEQAMTAFGAGARAVTHLFNAMSPFGHRQPGLPGAAIDCPDIVCGLIADGHHVHPATLRTALRALGPGRATLVTDAMATVGTAADRFRLGGREVRRIEGALRLDNGTLAGSDLDMAAAVRFAVEQLDRPRDEALRMASLYPARLLGLGDRGRLVAGVRADFIALDEGLVVRAVRIGGRAPAVP